MAKATQPEQKTKAKPFQPHELAPHVAAMFRMAPHTDMSPVQLAMNWAIKVLLAAEASAQDIADQAHGMPHVLVEGQRKHPKAANPTGQELTNPDYGISYALLVNRGEYPEEKKAAAMLLRLCLHAIERGHTVENERESIPLHLAALAGYVPDRNRRAARKPRQTRSKADALDRGLDDALRANPDGRWADIATWLEGEGIVKAWNADWLTFTDGEAETTINTRTFQNRITAAKKRAS